MNDSSQVNSGLPAVRLIQVGPTSGIERLPEEKPAIGNLRMLRIEQFLGTRNLSENTKRNYGRQLRYFLEWADKNWHVLTLNDLKNYKAHLEGKGLGISSVGAYLTALKSMFTWMLKAGFIDRNPAAALEIPVMPEGEGKNLDVHMVQALFDALPSRGESQTRDRAILCLLIRAGLRAEEVSLLNVGNYNGVEVNIVQAKHGSVGLVPVDRETHEALVDCLTLRWIQTQENLGNDDPIFVSYSNRNKGKRLSYEGIYKIVKELAASAGLEGVHPHRGRHTFISNLVEDGVDAYLAMELSRQRSVNTFKIYSKKARYVKAKSRFFETKGEKVRKAMSLEEMLAKG